MYLFFILYSICNFRNFSNQFPLTHKSGIKTSETLFWSTLITRLEEDAIGKMFPVSLGKYGKGGDFIYQVLSNRFKSDKTIIYIISPDTANGVGHVGNMAALNFIQKALKPPVSIKTMHHTTKRLYDKPYKKTVGSRKKPNASSLMKKHSKSPSFSPESASSTYNPKGGTFKRHRKNNRTTKNNRKRKGKRLSNKTGLCKSSFLQ